ncbi:MAG: hypothetical protein AB8G11_17615 [Saprospiraceae bacterium]
MLSEKLDNLNFFNVLVLVPCFVALPIVGWEVYESWYLDQPLAWTAEFTSMMVCAVLGSIAGLGIFLKLKWARIIALVFFITGMLIWFVIFAVEFSHKGGKAPMLTLLFMIYGICICILIFFNGNLMDDELKPREYHDILDK